MFEKIEEKSWNCVLRMPQKKKEGKTRKIKNYLADEVFLKKKIEKEAFEF